jgi:hypothetical protein
MRAEPAESMRLLYMFQRSMLSWLAADIVKSVKSIRRKGYNSA